MEGALVYWCHLITFKHAIILVILYQSGAHFISEFRKLLYAAIVMPKSLKILCIWNDNFFSSFMHIFFHQQAKLSLDLTKLLFPMAVSKLWPTPPITTTVMSLMSNTKVSPSTPKPNLTTPPLPPNTTPLPNTPQPTLKLFLRSHY